ncbi:MAG: hypothetical protein R3D69_17060 [Xanthobacteraceae bacterium]
MMSEMPLPMPRAVICSPSHIRNMVPPVSVMTVEMRKNQPGSATIAGAFQPDRDPIRLEQRQQDGQITRVLVDGLVAGLAFLFSLRAAAKPWSVVE